MIDLDGAQPLRREGVLLGAVGISGAPSGERDEEIARIGAAAFEQG